MANVNSFIKENIGAIGIGASGALLGGILGYAAGRKSSKKGSRSKRRTNYKSSRKRSRVHKVKGRRYTPHTAGKRRDTSRRRIRYTKNGQPYVILASGKARFIKNKSARTSRKRSGGRY